MRWRPTFLQRLRPFPSRRPWLQWLLVCVVLLKVATPWLATAAAHERGLPLADICSVYGVRTAALEEPAGVPQPLPASHAGTQHCVLMPLLAAAPLASPARSAVQLHAPAQACLQAPAEAPLRPDAGLAWLASRTHAPPSLV